MKMYLQLCAAFFIMSVRLVQAGFGIVESKSPGGNFFGFENSHSREGSVKQKKQEKIRCRHLFFRLTCVLVALKLEHQIFLNLQIHNKQASGAKIITSSL